MVHAEWMPGRGLAIVVGLATLAIVALQLRLGLHADDRVVLDGAAASYREIWTAPFLDRFYRPLVVALVKLSREGFGAVALPLRLIAGVLIVATVAGVARLPPVGEGRPVAALIALASPLTFVAVAPFAVGIGDLAVGLAFVAAVHLCREPGGGRDVALCAVVALALAAKESGLLVAAFGAIEQVRRRRLATATALGLLSLGYLALHATAAPPRATAFATGFLFDALSPAEQTARFGDPPLALYLYNVAASAVSLALYLPVNGQLRWSPSLAFLVPTCALTAWVAARWLARNARDHLGLSAVILLNPLFGFMYVRPRVLFVAQLAVAVAVGCALPDLPRGTRIALIALWLVTLAGTLVRLAHR